MKQNPYADIIDLPRPVSPTHSPMPMAQRAAQFSPFAALTGYDRIIKEAEKLTAERIELGEAAAEALNESLNLLAARTTPPGEPVSVELTWFVHDPLRLGGEYVTKTVQVRRVDAVYRMLELADRSLIPIEDLYDLRLPSGEE